MKKIKIHATSLGVVMLITFLMISCNTTKVISSWNLDPVPSGTMKKVLVTGVIGNREEREQIEQIMTSELRKTGIEANTATNVFGPKGFQGIPEEKISKKLKGSDYTAIMLISIQDKEKEKRYTPGTRYSTPHIVGYSRYYRRYIVVYDNIYTPGYYTTTTNYILEADIYTVNDDDELIYSAQTRSYDPGSTKSLAESFSKAIITELKEKGIITPN